MTDLCVSALNEADLGDLLALYRHLNPDDQPANIAKAKSQLRAIRAIDGCCILVGKSNEKMVTSCTLFVLPNLSRQGTPYALIENVVTHGAHRGLGFGKEILREACERAFAKGCYKVMLMTGSTKAETLRFYESAGFKQDKTGFQIRNRPVRPE